MRFMQELGISRDSKCRALRQLEEASLVRIEASAGMSARISLLNTRELDAAVRLPWRNSCWSVTADGMQSLTTTYEIPASQLAERRGHLAMWPVQMAEKSWVDIEVFLEAFRNALLALRPTDLGTIDSEATFALAREVAARRTITADTRKPVHRRAASDAGEPHAIGSNQKF